MARAAGGDGVVIERPSWRATGAWRQSDDTTVPRALRRRGRQRFVVARDPSIVDRAGMPRQRQRIASGCLGFVSVLALAACGGPGSERAAKGELRGVTTITPSAVPSGNPASKGYAPWPSFGHDAAHSGSAPVAGPRSGRLRWRRRLEDRVVPGPVVDRGGVAYAASNGGVLHAIDIATGRDRWSTAGGPTATTSRRRR